MTLFRAIAHRAGTSLVVFVVALCASAAAAIGPIYYDAARHSILQDTLATSVGVARGFEAVTQGSLSGGLPTMEQDVGDLVNRVGGGAATSRRILQPPVESLESTAFFRNLGQNLPFVWRSNVCAHLQLVHGACPSRPFDVIASSAIAAVNHWHVGDRLRPASAHPLTVTGIYTPPNATGDYWFGRGTVYFPSQSPATAIVGQESSVFDALFTTRATISALPSATQGTLTFVRALRVNAVRPADVDRLSRIANGLARSTTLFDAGIVLQSTMQQTAATVHKSWSALAVPVVVVTAELLVLTWLLLFLVVIDAVEARGPEIALAKLRGQGRRRTVVFGLAEPVTLLAIALPTGAVLGWVLTTALAGSLLRPGTHVALPALGWVAAAVAVLGGVAAVVAAAWATLARPVSEQWRRTGGRGRRRGWLFDAIVLTGAVAGLLQLALTGGLDSARHSALTLLVPGLLGLAAAVVGSRLLPIACQARFGSTRRGGGLGPFLAMRHIARRPGGSRTTMILGTAIALAAFGVSSWSIGANNRTRVASATVGAHTVLTVAPSRSSNLVDLVNRVDPAGHSATVVERFDAEQSSVLAVQPRRFAAVADWHAAFVSDPQRLLGGLDPPAPAPVVLRGSRVRLDLTVRALKPAGADVTIDVVVAGSTAPTPVDLGRAPAAGKPGILTADLPGCPCVVLDVVLAPVGQPATVQGAVTLRALSDRVGGRWRPVPGALTTDHWADTVDENAGASAGLGGLEWTFLAPQKVAPRLTVQDRPDPLPALVSRASAGDRSTLSVSGLNDAPLDLAVATVAPIIPSAGDHGYVVDLDYALRAAYFDDSVANVQIWVRGDPAPMRAALRRAGVPVLGVTSSGALDRQLSRQGPGLASVLFLADAAAAAVLAALAAILSLSAAARRRRYEYAALAAAGATRRTLYAALAIEQVLVVATGAVIGVVAGLVASGVSARGVPEFVQQPSRVLLTYRPDIALVAAAVIGGFVVLVGTAAVAAAALLRGVDPDQLREGPA